MHKDNVSKGGFHTLRELTLSQVICKADNAKLALQTDDATKDIDSVKNSCADLLRVWVEMWPAFIFWSHAYMVLSKIRDEKAPHNCTCKKRTVSTRKIKHELANQAKGCAVEPHDSEEHKRHNDMLKDIADLIDRLEHLVGDISCLGVQRNKFRRGEHETYFEQDVVVHPRQIVLKLKVLPAKPPPPSLAKSAAKDRDYYDTSCFLRSGSDDQNEPQQESPWFLDCELSDHLVSSKY